MHRSLCNCLLAKADRVLPCAQGPRRARKPVRVQRSNSDDRELPAVNPDGVSAEKNDWPLDEASPEAAPTVLAVETAADQAAVDSPPKPKLRGVHGVSSSLSSS